MRRHAVSGCRTLLLPLENLFYGSYCRKFAACGCWAVTVVRRLLYGSGRRSSFAAPRVFAAELAPQQLSAERRPRCQVVSVIEEVALR